MMASTVKSEASNEKEKKGTIKTKGGNSNWKNKPMKLY